MLQPFSHSGWIALNSLRPVHPSSPHLLLHSFTRPNSHPLMHPFPLNDKGSGEDPGEGRGSLRRSITRGEGRHTRGPFTEAPCTPSLIHSLTHSLTHSSLTQSFIHSLIHSFSHSFSHSFIQSSIHAFMHSCIHAFLHSCIHTYIHSFTQSIIHTCIPSFNCSIIQSVNPSGMQSFNHVFHSLIQSFTHSLIHPSIQYLSLRTPEPMKRSIQRSRICTRRKTI